MPRVHTPPRWVVAVSMAVAAAILGDSLLYAVLPVVWPELGLEAPMVGVLLAANRFVRPLANPLAGRVMSRHGVRTPLLAALVLSVVSTAAYAGAGFALFLVARLAWGVCWSFLRLAGILAALESSGSRRRGYYLGFFNGATRFGSLLAVVAGGVLTDAFGFSVTVYVFAAVSIAGVVLIAVERPPIAPPLAPLEGIDDDAMATPRHEDWAAGRNRVLDVCNLIQGMAVSGLVSATLGLWLVERFGTRIDAGGLVLGAATLSGVLLGSRFVADALWGPFAGHLSDRHGRGVVAVSAGVLQTLALALLPISAGLAWTAGAAVVLFIAAAAFQVALDATAGDLAPPAARARRLSWYATWWDIGAAAGPLIGYSVGPAVGLAWTYRGMAIALAASAVAYAVAFRRLSSSGEPRASASSSRGARKDPPAPRHPADRDAATPPRDSSRDAPPSRRR